MSAPNVPTTQTVTPLPALDSTDWYGWATDVDTWVRAVASGSVTGVGLAPNVQTGNYTLALADEQALVSVNASTATTVTVPPNLTVPFPQGSRIFIAQAGAGQVTVAAGTGVTLRPPTGRDMTTNAQYSVISLRQAAVNTWYLEGDLTRTTVDPSVTTAIGAAVNYSGIFQFYTGTAWPNRQNTSGTNRPIIWVGPNPGPASGGTTAGGSAKYAPGDILLLS